MQNADINKGMENEDPDIIFGINCLNLLHFKGSTLTKEKDNFKMELLSFSQRQYLHILSLVSFGINSEALTLKINTCKYVGNVARGLCG